MQQPMKQNYDSGSPDLHKSSESTLCIVKVLTTCFAYTSVDEQCATYLI